MVSGIHLGLLEHIPLVDKGELLFLLLTNIKIPEQSYLWWKQLVQGCRQLALQFEFYSLLFNNYSKKGFFKEFFNMFTYIYTMLEMTVDISLLPFIIKGRHNIKVKPETSQC